MGRFDVLLTAVVTGPLVADGAAAILVSTSSQCADSQAAPTWFCRAATLRDGGALLRMAGVSVEQIGHTLRDHLAFLSPLVGDDLWSRKW